MANKKKKKKCPPEIERRYSTVQYLDARRNETQCIALLEPTNNASTSAIAPLELQPYTAIEYESVDVGREECGDDVLDVSALAPGPPNSRSHPDRSGCSHIKHRYSNGIGMMHGNIHVISV